jgi:hypothetical protein
MTAKCEVRVNFSERLSQSGLLAGKKFTPTPGFGGIRALLDMPHEAVTKTL